MINDFNQDSKRPDLRTERKRFATFALVAHLELDRLGKKGFLAEDAHYKREDFRTYAAIVNKYRQINFDRFLITEPNEVSFSLELEFLYGKYFVEALAENNLQKADWLLGLIVEARKEVAKAFLARNGM